MPRSLIAALLLILALTACAPTPVPITDSAPPPALAGTYVGAFADDAAAIGLATENGKVIAYICDGLYVSEWLRGELIGTTFDGTSAGGLTLHVTFDATSASGTVALPDQDPVPFTAELAQGDAGLYRANQNELGEAYVAGWILLNDGRQVGAINGFGGGLGGGIGGIGVAQGGFAGQIGGGFGGFGGGFAGQIGGGQTDGVGQLGGGQTDGVGQLGGGQTDGVGQLGGGQIGGAPTTDGSTTAGGETVTTTTTTGGETTTTTGSADGSGTSAPTTAAPTFIPAPFFDPTAGEVDTPVGVFRPRRAHLFLST